MDYLYNIIRVKVEEAISDADKASSEYKYYDVRKTKILASLKKPIKDNPFLESFSDSLLRSTCSSCFFRIVSRRHDSPAEEIPNHRP